MKKISFLIVLFPLVILIFFTLFGKYIYEYTTPKVKVIRVSASIQINNIEYLEIPSSAITDDCHVYIVSEIQGFSQTIYTVNKQEVNYIKLPNTNLDKVYISSGINRGIRIISQISKELLLEDGDRVLIEY